MKTVTVSSGGAGSDEKLYKNPDIPIKMTDEQYDEWGKALEDLIASSRGNPRLIVSPQMYEIFKKVLGK